MPPTNPLLLHGFRLSGHSHRAELMLSLLDLPFTFRDVNLRGGEQKDPAFLTLNPFGQVPVLEDGDVVIADSAAILVYLAAKYDPSHDWLPTDPVAAAQVQRWLSVAQGPLFNGPCAARAAVLFGRALDIDRARTIAADLFAGLEDHLSHHDFLVGAGPTIADVALYSYTARAPEGGIALEPYPHLRRWLERIEALPRFRAMPRSPSQAA